MVEILQIYDVQLRQVCRDMLRSCVAPGYAYALVNFDYESELNCMITFSYHLSLYFSRSDQCLCRMQSFEVQIEEQWSIQLSYAIYYRTCSKVAGYFTLYPELLQQGHLLSAKFFLRIPRFKLIILYPLVLGSVLHEVLQMFNGRACNDRREDFFGPSKAMQEHQ